MSEAFETSFRKSIRAAFRPESRRIIWAVFASTIALFVITTVTIGGTVFGGISTLLSMADMMSGWHGWIYGIVSIGLVWLFILLLSWFFLPAFSAVMLYFIEDLININTDIDYPNWPPRRPEKLTLSISDAIWFFLLMVGLNILAFPVAIIAGILVPVLGSILLYFCLNGYLIAKEFHKMIAGRYLTGDALKKNWRKNFIGFFILGCLAYFLLLIPILNLIAPFFVILSMFYYWHDQFDMPDQIDLNGSQKLLENQ